MFIISCCLEVMRSTHIIHHTIYVYLDCPKKNCLHSIACYIFCNGLHLETIELNKPFSYENKGSSFQSFYFDLHGVSLCWRLDKQEWYWRGCFHAWFQNIIFKTIFYQTGNLNCLPRERNNVWFQEGLTNKFCPIWEWGLKRVWE